jgi:hypothetical protein
LAVLAPVFEPWQCSKAACLLMPHRIENPLKTNTCMLFEALAHGGTNIDG